jgi:hypothetical protein
VHDQAQFGIEIDDNVFGAPSNRANSRAFEMPGEAPRQRTPQLMASQHDLRNGTPNQCFLKAAADSFDLWEFGHLAWIPV